MACAYAIAYHFTEDDGTEAEKALKWRLDALDKVVSASEHGDVGADGYAPLT